MLNASVDLLDHLGLDHHAKLIESAITKTVNVDKIWTPGKNIKISLCVSGTKYLKVLKLS